jgi:hypothetical protein
MHVILLVTTFVPVGENIQDTLHRQASGHTGRMNGIAQACLQKGLLQPISPVSPPCQVQSTLPTHPHPSRRSLSTVAFLLSCQSAISADAKALARQESIHRMPIVSAAVFSTPQALFSGVALENRMGNAKMLPMHATPLEPPRERPLHAGCHGRCPSFSPRLAIAAGIRREGLAPFLRRRHFDTRYISCECPCSAPDFLLAQ